MRWGLVYRYTLLLSKFFIPVGFEAMSLQRPDKLILMLTEILTNARGLPFLPQWQQSLLE